MTTISFNRIIGFLLPFCSISFLVACENKAYQSAEQISQNSDASSESSVGGGLGSHSHNKLTTEDAPNYPEVVGPPVIIPVSTDVSANIIKRIEQGFPKGPDCKGAGSDGAKAVSIDCPQRPTFKEALWSLLVSKAWAGMDNDTIALPDRTLTQSQLLAMTPSQSSLWKSYHKLSRIHFFSNSKGPLFNDFDFVITFIEGQELWANGNSSIQEACSLVSQSFPKNGKDYFEAVEVGGSEHKKLQNPTSGKICSAETLAAYRVINISEQLNSKKRVPSIVFLMARDENKNQSYVLHRKLQGSSSDFIYDLQNLLGTKVVAQNDSKKVQQ